MFIPLYHDRLEIKLLEDCRKEGVGRSVVVYQSFPTDALLRISGLGNRRLSTGLFLLPSCLNPLLLVSTRGEPILGHGDGSNNLKDSLSIRTHSDTFRIEAIRGNT